MSDPVAPNTVGASLTKNICQSLTISKTRPAFNPDRTRSQIIIYIYLADDREFLNGTNPRIYQWNKSNI